MSKCEADIFLFDLFFQPIFICHLVDSILIAGVNLLLPTLYKEMHT